MRNPGLLSLVFFSVLGLAPLGAQTAVPAPSQAAEVTLPASGTVYAVERPSEGAKLVQLHAAEPSWNSHPATNFLRAQVFAGASATLELKGLNAPVHLAGATPVLYVRINSEDPELMRRRVRLLQMVQMRDSRVVFTYSRNSFGGQRKSSYKEIPVDLIDVEPNVWVKVTPKAPLQPGEYGIVFMPKDPGFSPDAVYDFDLSFAEATPEARK